MLLVEAAVERVAPLHVLDDVGDVVIAAVGHDGRQVGHLKRRAAQLALTDREREHRERVPGTAVAAVVERTVGHVAVALAEEVRVEFAAEAEALDIAFPHVVPLLHVAVLRVVQNIAEHVAEVGVARGRYGIAQVEGRGVGVALHAQAPQAIALAAGMQVTRTQHPLLHADEALHQLEGRTRRIAGLHRAVVERLTLVAEHLHIVIAALAADQLVGIVRGRRHHHQDLARGGFDGHDRPHLAAHELLAEELEADVDRAGQAAARPGHRVVAAVHVGAADGSVGVDFEHAHALGAAQLLLVGRLHAAHAHVVARTVLGVALEHAGIHLAHETQQVAPHLARILTRGAVHRMETAEMALVETQLVLLRKVAHQQPRRTRTHAGVAELAFELFARQTRHGAELRRIEPLAVDVAVGDHQVVARTALHQVFAVAVEHLAARGVEHLVPQHVGTGQLDVAGIEELEVSQPQDDHAEDQQHDRLQGPHPHQFVARHSFTVSLEVSRRAAIHPAAAVAGTLAARRSSVCPKWVHDSDSSRKKSRWWSVTPSSR